MTRMSPLAPLAAFTLAEAGVFPIDPHAMAPTALVCGPLALLAWVGLGLRRQLRGGR